MYRWRFSFTNALCEGSDVTAIGTELKLFRKYFFNIKQVGIELSSFINIEIFNYSAQFDGKNKY